MCCIYIYIYIHSLESNGKHDRLSLGAGKCKMGPRFQDLFFQSRALWNNILTIRYCIRTIAILLSLSFAILFILKTTEKQ